MGKQLKVLVTGGAGYIGSHAVLALKDAGHSPVVIDNLVTGFRWAIPDDVSFVEGNIADEKLVATTLRDHCIDGIMHFAGSIIVPESVENPLKYYRNNTAASRSLIESAVYAGVKHFIFSSTAATYGIPESSPVREDMPKSPINPYGMSKLMTEHMLRDVAAAHDFNYCALRYFNVAGADPQGRTGQSTAGATHLIKVAVEAALGKRDSVAVFGTDYATADGTGVRDYIHVSDLAAAHVIALEALVADPCHQPHAELRLWPRLFGAAGARRGRSRHQSDHPPQTRRSPRGRSGRADFGQPANQGAIWLAAGI
jgi:UDP-glucose 4-epimerase